MAGEVMGLAFKKVRQPLSHFPGVKIAAIRRGR